MTKNNQLFSGLGIIIIMLLGILALFAISETNTGIEPLDKIPSEIYVACVLVGTVITVIVIIFGSTTNKSE